MASLRVYLCGEGKDDIGRWAVEAAYRQQAQPSDGVIGTLARKMVPDGWQVVDGRPLKNVPVLRVGGGERGSEARRFRGAVQLAREAECDVLLFARDEDGDGSRGDELRALAAAPYASPPEVALAVVVPCIEGWVLELLRPGSRTKAKAQAEWSEHQAATGVSMEEVVLAWGGSRERLTHDLQRWLERVKGVLTR